MLRGPRLQANTGDNVGREIDEVGQVGIELDELLSSDVEAPRGAFQPRVGLEHRGGRVEALAQERRGRGLLGEHAPRCDLADVGRGHVDADLEAILELRQLDALVVDRRHHLVQLLL